MGECFLKDDFNDPTLVYHIIRPAKPEKYIKDVALSDKDMEDPDDYGGPEFSAWVQGFISQKEKELQEA